MIREEAVNNALVRIHEMQRVRTNAAYAVAGAVSAMFTGSGGFHASSDSIAFLKGLVAEFVAADNALDNVRVG